MSTPNVSVDLRELDELAKKADQRAEFVETNYVEDPAEVTADAQRRYNLIGRELVEALGEEAELCAEEGGDLAAADRSLAEQVRGEARSSYLSADEESAANLTIGR